MDWSEGTYLYTPITHPTPYPSSIHQTNQPFYYLQVGEVQGGWDRAENKFDNAVDDVEEFPENVAGWAGEKVGDAERFGDNMENAYDDGKEEGRYGERYDGW